MKEKKNTPNQKAKTKQREKEPWNNSPSHPLNPLLSMVFFFQFFQIRWMVTMCFHWYAKVAYLFLGQWFQLATQILFGSRSSYMEKSLFIIGWWKINECFRVKWLSFFFMFKYRWLLLCNGKWYRWVKNHIHIL